MTAGLIEGGGNTWLLENEDIEEDLKTRTRLDAGDAGTVLLGWSFEHGVAEGIAR